MLHISLFSGIGGFDLAAEWAGWTNIVSCEINPFGNKVLNHYWPDAYHHTDIHTLTIEKINEELTKRHGANWRTNDIVLTGGFPCQPYSLAGKRLGKEDERHLWPEMLRVIQEVKPTWIVGENVFGLVNWSDGLVFDEVQADLETAGYEVQAFVLPACAADAPHRRDRVWIVAYRDGNGQHRSNGKHEVNASEGGQYAQRETIKGAKYGDAANAKSLRSHRKAQHENSDRQSGEQGRCYTYDFSQIQRRNFIANAANIGQKQPWNTREWRSGLEDGHSDAKRFSANANGIRQPGEKHGHQESGINCENSKGINWHNFPTQSPVCSRNDGLSAELDGITFSRWRNESIKAAGNAIVPQIAYRIFDTINQYNQTP